TDIFKDFGVIMAVLMVISVVTTIFYTMILNIGITLKYYNIINLREGAALMDQIEQRESSTDINE
ncbi:MAG: hypothetical protein MJB14_16265, partial [Spirochaetes bacterium]|nr:hypothetical protein [Spirochaetota bacterium]